MKTRIVHTKVWKDEWFVNLSKDAKFLWLYLLTNDKINISGIYELTEREIHFDLGTDISQKVKDELKPKANFYKNWVFIPNVEKYNSYKNAPTNQKAFTKEINDIPNEIIQMILSDTSINTSNDTSIYTHHILLEIINKKSEIINNKLEIRNKESEIEEVSEMTQEEMKKELEDKRKELYKKMNWR